MSKRQQRLPLTPLGSLWLVGGLSLVMAPHLLRLPVWLSAFCLLALVWRLARDLREWPLPGMAIRLLLTAGGIGAVFVAFGTIIGQSAGVALLTVMLSLKLVEMSTLRDAVVVVLLAYFLVAAGFLFEQSLLAGVYLFGAVVVLTAALIVVNHPGSRPELTRHYLRRSGLLMLQALPLMAVLFVLFPRVQGAGWSLGVPTSSARMGLSDSLTMGDVGNLSSSGEIAFRVEFQGQPPVPGLRYWRGPVLWHTNGRRWTLLTPAEQHRAGAPRPFTPLGPAVDYTVSVAPENTGRWLPVLDLPVMVPDKAIATADLQVISVSRARIPGSTLRYQARSYPQARWEGLSPALRAEALRLPPGVNTRTLALGQQWAAYPARQRVQTALRYFRDGPFRYTRHPPVLGEVDPVDQFLFETRQGFCEHYAVAFTVLMRAAGLPARIVTGYEGGEFNALGNYWVIRQSDAHAWAEVYLEEEGWIRVDPTSVIPATRTDADVANDVTTLRKWRSDKPWGQMVWRMAAEGLDAINFRWNHWVAGYSVERQRELLGRMGILAWGNAGLVAVLAAAAALAVAVAFRFGRRPRRDNDPALRLYQRFCARLARKGMARRPNEGELAFAARVARERPEWAAQAAAITALYQRSRYGGGEAPPLPQLKAAVAAFRP